MQKTAKSKHQNTYIDKFYKLLHHMTGRSSKMNVDIFQKIVKHHIKLLNRRRR